MGSETRRRALVAVGAVFAAAALDVAGSAHADAAQWWVHVALQGTPLAAVTAAGRSVTVRTDAGMTLRSSDGGAHFAEVPGDPQLPPVNVVSAAGISWMVDGAGNVLRRSAPNQPLTHDPGSPMLGAGAALIAAPAALPGVVVAVATDGTVWRRGADGGWARAFLLLPQSLVQGVPRVTAIAAFTSPLSATVYLGTDGYAVLNSTDGGDDWIRAGPGLPDSVTGLAADSSLRAIFAATPDGLWVHELQALPSPPAYHDAALVWRWVGIGLVTLVASALALGALLRALPRNDAGDSHS